MELFETRQQSSMTLDLLIRIIAKNLTKAGVENAALEARLLVAHAAGFERNEIISKANDIIKPQARLKLDGLVSRRLDGEPVHRILGYRDFFNHRFFFGQGVLEPRVETELLVEKIIADFSNDLCPAPAVQNSNAIRFCEIGIGSGIITISLLKAMPNFEAKASDISDEALKFAEKNAANLGVGDRIELIKTDCLSTINDRFDFIVSNPPYIASAEIKTLAIEVKQHDPTIALDGGYDGLEIYRRILDQAGARLKPHGRLYLETGHGQHKNIETLAKQSGFEVLEKLTDLCNLERILVLGLA